MTLLKRCDLAGLAHSAQIRSRHRLRKVSVCGLQKHINNAGNNHLITTRYEQYSRPMIFSLSVLIFNMNSARLKKKKFNTLSYPTAFISVSSCPVTITTFVCRYVAP